MTRCRDIYLKIERLPGYSPLASDDAEKILFRRDCMYNHGHEDGKIPDSEVALSRLDAILFREYLDPAYTIPNMAKLVEADINIKLPISGRDPGRIHVVAPASGSIAAPGPYLLFIPNAAGVPSLGRFMRVH